ncbi:hypothetical protein [Methylorubrum salsuginis]|uniref:hypothetical protein n=1 Tax=Methylorubrum salsuginis TaxID=414703 RepID=UPI0013F4E36C|nr:hypothetical protein [Methylorubrum salsuginis]
MVRAKHVVEGGDRKGVGGDKDRDGPLRRTAITVHSLQHSLLQRPQALSTVTVNGNAGIGLRPESAIQNGVGEPDDVCPRATVVLAAKIERLRLERSEEIIKPTGVGALEVVDALLRIP